MNMQELLAEVDKLSPDELELLRQKIEQRQQAGQGFAVEKLEQAIEDLRAGLSEEDLLEIEWAMNASFPSKPDADV